MLKRDIKQNLSPRAVDCTIHRSMLPKIVFMFANTTTATLLWRTLFESRYQRQMLPCDALLALVKSLGDGAS